MKGTAIAMMTVQQHLKELDKKKLISMYISEHRGWYIESPGYADKTVREITDGLREALSRYIDRLRTIPITESQDGQYVLFAHRTLTNG